MLPPAAGQEHRPTQHRPLVQVVGRVAVGREPVQMGVDRRAVVALAVVVEEELPVGLHLVDRPVGRGEVGDPPLREAAGQRRKAFRERRPVLPEMNEEQALPGLEPRLDQPVLGLLEARHVGHVGRPEQPPVQAVGPGVVGTLDRLAETAPLLQAEQAPTVAADVVEGPRPPLPVGERDDALGAELEAEVAPRLADLGDVTGVEPASAEDPLPLLGEELGRGEELLRQGPLAVRAARSHGERISRRGGRVRISRPGKISARRRSETRLAKTR